MKLSDVNRKAYEIYEDLRNSNRLHKEDARRAIPVASSQEGESGGLMPGRSVTSCA